MTTQLTGLSSREAAEKLTRFGPNTLPETPPPSSLRVFLGQLRNPLVYVLLLAGIVTILLQHLSDALIIFFSVVLNTILGFVQEKKASQAFAALKKFISTTAQVIRDGHQKKIEIAELVPGDLIMLSAGSKIPADGELLSVNRAYFDEAIITGESLPVSKKIGDSLYMGTVVVTGQAQMKVTVTGIQTRIGNIANKIQTTDEDTPLKRQLTDFSKKLLILVVILISFVLISGYIRNNDLYDLFATSVALAVSSIPEGLIVSMTVVLAIGMQRILRRKGLVKKLSSAETLGGVTTICIDKTGTLTEGKMQVVHYVGNQAELSRQVILANDLDDPLVIAAYEWGSKTTKNTLKNEYARLDSIPFSSKEKFFVSLHTWSSSTNKVFVNGAPDALLPWTNLDAREKKGVVDQIEELSSQGYRLLGLAQKEVASTKTSLEIADAKSNLTWIGMLAFFDPVRASVKDALADAHSAGIKVLVITGDYSNTARFVLSKIGIDLEEHQIITGDILQTMSAEELSKKLATIRLFARTTPDQKHMIVTALQHTGEIVAMMGDGVNDAPAIYKADIGIAVNEASDVAKESADLILLDSNFSTVIAAVEEGRAIFDNIRKIILYLLSDAFAEILVVVCSILFGLPLPITAVQIIWINLVSDGFPSLALTIDPKVPGIMNAPPRSPKENIVSGWMMGMIATVSVLAGGVALLVFVITLTITSDIALARSLCFATLGLNSLAYVFSVRTLTQPFWRSSIFGNKWLILAVGAGFMLQVIPFATVTLRNFFGVVPLSVHHWLIAVALSIGVFLAVEILKVVPRHKLNIKLF